MVYIIAARKTTPNSPAHATRFQSIEDAKIVLAAVYSFKCNWLTCKIVDQAEYELICKQHPCIAANTRCNDTMEKI